MQPGADTPMYQQAHDQQENQQRDQGTQRMFDGDVAPAAQRLRHLDEIAVGLADKQFPLTVMPSHLTESERCELRQDDGWMRCVPQFSAFIPNLQDAVVTVVFKRRRASFQIAVAEMGGDCVGNLAHLVIVDIGQQSAVYQIICQYKARAQDGQSGQQPKQQSVPN